MCLEAHVLFAKILLIGVGWALRQQNFAVLFKDRGDNIESFQHGHQ